VEFRVNFEKCTAHQLYFAIGMTTRVPASPGKEPGREVTAFIEGTEEFHAAWVANVRRSRTGPGLEYNVWGATLSPCWLPSGCVIADSDDDDDDDDDKDDKDDADDDDKGKDKGKDKDKDGKGKDNDKEGKDKDKDKDKAGKRLRWKVGIIRERSSESNASESRV
jgi:hypothetical protein